MSILDSLLTNFSSPIILCFILGLVARLLKSDLELPDQLYTSISIYLLLAIGLKGGIQLSESTLAEVSGPLAGVLVISALTTSIAFVVARYLGRIDLADSAALAAHYGSVSAVTFMTCLSFLNESQVAYPGYATALFALMEVPAVLLAPGLFALSNGSDFRQTIREVATGKTTLLLVGGIIIGLVAGKDNSMIIMPMFGDLFYGVLAFFLLEMGLLVGKKLADVPKLGTFLLAYALTLPVIQGFIGVSVAVFFGMELGGATVMGVLAGSASYIAAPAAVRANIPEANPAYYVTSSLAITFPFNITFGIPLYFWFAEMLLGKH